MTAKKTRKTTKPRKDVAADLPFAVESTFQATPGDVSLHDLFQQQTMAMLDRSDLSEEQKQSILVAMN